VGTRNGQKIAGIYYKTKIASSPSLLLHPCIQNNPWGGKMSLGVESDVIKTHFYLGDVAPHFRESKF
jgi:hypothetical protein